MLAADHKNGREERVEREPLAGDEADRRRAPERRGRIEASHIEALLEDDAGAEKAKAGDDLGRHARRAVFIRNDPGIGDKDRSAECDQRVGP